MFRLTTVSENSSTVCGGTLLLLLLLHRFDFRQDPPRVCAMAVLQGTHQGRARHHQEGRRHEQNVHEAAGLGGDEGQHSGGGKVTARPGF